MHRRGFLRATTGFAVFGLTIPMAYARKLPGLSEARIRGSLDATQLGVRPGSSEDQSAAFRTMLAEASRRNMPLFLPPGRYLVSNIALPSHTQIIGVPGATRVIQGGDSLFHAEGRDHIGLTGLTFDGVGLPLGAGTNGLVDLRQISHLAIEDCGVMGSGKHGIAFEAASGRIANSEISKASDAGIYSIDGSGLDITGNHVADCGNGGILVWRGKPGDDRTMVSGNRVERIRADAGGTGQNGNGINTFRADNVIVSGNTISDCAFSALRANSCNNVQFGNNTCLRSGETAIYAEFSFEGAVINANVVDHAANGISIVNFDKGGRLGTCTGNIVRNLTSIGPYPAEGAGFGTGISVEADCTASNNVIEGAPLFGMQIGWGPFMRDVVATGNVIREANVGIAVSVVEGTGLAVISGNVIDNARNGAIVGYRWADPATGDLARENSDKFLNLEIGKNSIG
jgi:uncharacterized secreted repeat protein (TIGR03808 family)